MSNFRGWPEQQTYEGIEGARRFIRDWTEGFDDWSIELEAIHDAGGERVVTVLRQRAVSKLTGMPVDMRLGLVYTVRDGRQTRVELYADPGEALRAAGLAK
jgi:ketosteroid isomerase-like protein